MEARITVGFHPGLRLCLNVLCWAVMLAGCCASEEESGRSHLRLSRGFSLKLILYVVL